MGSEHLFSVSEIQLFGVAKWEQPPDVMIITRTPFRSRKIVIGTAACLLCQWRSFSASSRLFAETPTTNGPSVKPLPPRPSALEKAPKAYGKEVEKEFNPEPLDRPIGLPTPPRPGQNTGIDPRTWKQRRDDFVNYDKHLVKRKQMTTKMATPYYREWKNMKFHKGKSFLAPSRLFKADRALYFPNLYGETLLKSNKWRDTTPILEDKVSIISIYSSTWAENQAATFTSAKANPELHELIKNSGGVAQLVQVNMEDNRLKSWLIKLFIGGTRKKLGAESWGKYFLVRHALPMNIRDAIGLLNSRVGYTYLLDGECKIRWAGSGNSEGDEKENLVKGVRKLIEESKAKINSRNAADLKELAEAKLEESKVAAVAA